MSAHLKNGRESDMESFMSKNGQSHVVTWIFGERTPNMCQSNSNEVLIIIIFAKLCTILLLYTLIVVYLLIFCFDHH
jgi:hypothetical protein